MRKPETLNEFRQQIQDEAEWVDVKPYSHNIVGLLLSQMAEKYGDAEAEKAIEDFGLKHKGW